MTLQVVLVGFHVFLIIIATPVTHDNISSRPFQPFPIRSDPYNKFDPAIGEYIECKTLTNGKMLIKKCLLSEEASMGTGPIRLAYQSAFSVERGVLHSGCWAHAAEYIENTCTIGSCGSNTRYSDIHFCCCRGNLCNLNLYVRPEVEDAPNNDFAD